MDALRYLPFMLAALCLVLGIAFYVRNRSRLRQGQTAIGKIVGWHTFHRSNGNHYIPEVQFATPDGRAVTFKSKYTAVVQPMMGRAFSVLYNPDDPVRAELKDNISSQHAVWVCAISAAIFALGGSYLWLR